MDEEQRRLLEQLAMEKAKQLQQPREINQPIPQQMSEPSIGGQDPEFESWKQSNPNVPSFLAQQAYENFKNKGQKQAQAGQQQINPYMNVANKATGNKYN